MKLSRESASGGGGEDDDDNDDAFFLVGESVTLGSFSRVTEHDRSSEYLLFVLTFNCFGCTIFFFLSFFFPRRLKRWRTPNF